MGSFGALCELSNVEIFKMLLFFLTQFHLISTKHYGKYGKQGEYKLLYFFMALCNYKMPLLHFSSDMACSLKMAGHRAKQCEIWDSGTLVTYIMSMWCIWCTFHLVAFKVIPNLVLAGKWPSTLSGTKGLLFFDLHWSQF